MSNNELKQVNADIIFFFLSVVTSFTSFFIINEKKKSILNIPHLNARNANSLYRKNRLLIVIVALYFFLNAYYSLKRDLQKGNDDGVIHDDILLLISTGLSFIAALAYLPLGNSNVIIKE